MKIFRFGTSKSNKIPSIAKKFDNCLFSYMRYIAPTNSFFQITQQAQIPVLPPPPSLRGYVDAQPIKRLNIILHIIKWHSIKKLEGMLYLCTP